MGPQGGARSLKKKNEWKKDATKYGLSDLKYFSNMLKFDLYENITVLFCFLNTV